MTGKIKNPSRMKFGGTLFDNLTREQHFRGFGRCQTWAARSQIWEHQIMTVMGEARLVQSSPPGIREPASHRDGFSLSRGRRIGPILSAACPAWRVERALGHAP